MKAYYCPKTLRNAVAFLGRNAGVASPFAGGTDLLPRWIAETRPRPAAIVDLKQIKKLSGISQADGEIRIGACTVMSELEAAPLIRTSAPMLARAAGRIACSQVRNRATLGGNLCNASPAADTAIPLILLDAVLELTSWNTEGITERQVPIAGFFVGPGSTVRGPGEILTRIRFKPQPATDFADWDKFGTRPSMEIAVASIGVALRVENETVTRARVAYGSVAPTPLRGRQAEAVLVGEKLSAAVIARCVAAARNEIAPITDVRAGQEYRREIVGVMLQRMLDHAAST